MLLSIFRLNYAFINLLLAIFLAGLWSIPFITHFERKSISQNVLQLDFGQIEYNLSVVLAYASTFIIAYLMNGLFNKANLSSKTSSLPGLLFIVFMIYDPQHFFFSGEHVFYICLLAGLILMCNINRNYQSMETTFLFGVLLGIGTLFLNVGVFALIIPWIFLSILRPFVWREYLGGFLGFFLVACVLVGIQLFRHSGALNIFPDEADVELLPHSGAVVELTFVMAFFFGVMLLAGLRVYLKKLSTSVLRWKKLSRILLIGFLVLCGACVLSGMKLYANDVYFPVSILCAFIVSFYLQEPKREWLQVLAFHAFLILALVNHFI